MTETVPLLGQLFPREVSSKSTAFLTLLTVGLGGLQGIFAVQFAYGPPFLEALGLSKSLMALVWIAGPISGTFIQPYFGITSDECRLSWGRRRPFIVVGALAVITSLLGLAWTNELVTSVARLSGLANYCTVTKSLTISTAVFLVCLLNVAIQPVQGCLRALIVDSCPRHQQDEATAWAGRWASSANVFSYLCGFANLPKLLPFLGTSQFQVLCAINCTTLAISVALTCWAIRERDPRTPPASTGDRRGTWARLRYLSSSFRRLPTQVQQVCKVQFFAWMGWFPFLFYIALYMGKKFRKESNMESSNAYSTRTDAMADKEARAGSLGLLIFSVVALLAGTILPMLMPTERISSALQQDSRSAPQHLTTTLHSHLNVRTLWMISHILFACCMLATILISSLVGTYVLVGILGVSWAVTSWAPYAIIGSQISTNPRDTSQPTVPETDKDYETQPGVVLGLHNAAIAIPQIIAGVGSSAIFWIVHGMRMRAVDDDSIGWVLRLSAISAVVAAFLSRGPHDDLDIRIPA